MVTSDHTHLPVYDHGGPDVIPKSIQLSAGRIGQEYNVRKKKKCFLAGPLSCNRC